MKTIKWGTCLNARPCLFRLYIIILFLLFTGMKAASQETPSSCEDRIRSYFRHDRWEAGEAAVDSALQNYPMVAAFYELKGTKILHDIDDIQKQETSTGKKNDAEKQKAYELSRYYLIKSIDMDEKNLNSRRMLMRIETETGHYSSAIVYCNELLEENPYNEHLWRSKIDLYRKLGNDLEADRLLERLQTIYHDDPQLRRDLADRKYSQSLEQRNKGDYRGMEESLRQLIELEPDNIDHYQTLVNLLYRNGKLDDAADMAERGVQMLPPSAQRDTLIAKRVSMLVEMNRLVEAQTYLKAKLKDNRSAYLSRILNDLGIETARQARWNDPYEAYAKIYDQEHSAEALNYLIGTSVQRNYYDDALYYIGIARKANDTPKLMYQEYLVLKRSGNPKKAEAMLKELCEKVPGDSAVAIELSGIYMDKTANLILQGQYDEAIPFLLDVCAINTEREIQQAARMRLYNCYLQTRRLDLAEAVLEEYNSYNNMENFVIQKAMLLKEKGRVKDALDLLAAEYNAQPDSDSYNLRRRNISYSYEEIAVPYIKNMVASGMTNAAYEGVKDALLICPQSPELLRYAISLSLAKKQPEQASWFAEQGIKNFPYDTYFNLKYAQLQIEKEKYASSINSLRKLLDVYPGDTTIVLAFTDCSEKLAKVCLEKHQNEQALAILDTALVFNPTSHDLHYTKYLTLCKMKRWKEAELSLKGYKPDVRELAAHRRSVEEVANQQMLNAMSLEYQQARLGSEDAITANAYFSYSRKLPWQSRRMKNRVDVLSFGMAYAGRDGKGSDDAGSDLVRGGTGVQLTAAYEHQFNDRLTGRLEAGWSNRYFPTWVINLSGTYDLKNNWQLMARGNVRWLKTYTGRYNLVHEFAGYDDIGNPVYANVMKLTGWDITSKCMAQLGLGANKTLGVEDRFNLSGGADLFYLSGNFYANGNVKMQFFPLQDRKSYLFAQGGLGTAPESSLIDQSLAVGFSDLNTFVSMGGRYFFNRWISLGLSGSWYTLLSQKETLSLPLNGTTAQTTKNYSNYFYIHTSVQINF